MKSLQLLLIALKATLLACGVASGEVVAVVVDLGNGSTGYGTGFTSGAFSDGTTAILTAGHNVEGARSVQITWSGGLIPAQVVCSIAEPRLDVAVLAVELPSRWTPIHLVRDPPREARVTYFGYSFHGLANREYQRREGVADISQGSIPGLDCTPGNSGGPVIIDGGGCVGLLRSRNAVGERDSIGQVVGYGVNFVTSHDIAAWIDQQNLDIGPPPEELVQCVGGRCYYHPRPRGFVVQSPAVIVRPRSVEIVVPPPVIVDPRATYPGSIRRPVVPQPPRDDPTPLRGCNCSPSVGGDRGAVGPVGPSGPRGSKGEPGEACECPSTADDIATLKAEVARLKSLKFPVRTLKPDGTVFSEDTVTLGGPIEFRLVPKMK